MPTLLLEYPFSGSRSFDLWELICDLVSEKEAKRALSEEMVPVMQEFKEVESCVRCSAKARFNVNEVTL